LAESTPFLRRMFSRCVSTEVPPESQELIFKNRFYNQEPTKGQNFMSFSRTAVFLVATILLLLACVPVPNALAITLGQVDDFEDGTVQNWGGLSTSNDPTAGPTDSALFASTPGGGGPGGRLLILNGHTAQQWAGNWTAAGVTSISMDFRNSGNNDLSFRLGIAGPGGISAGGGGDSY